MKQEVDVKVTGVTKELVIRTGDAKKMYEPARHNLEGCITAPGNFLKVRNSKKETDHVIFSRDGMSLTFVYNERMPEGGQVTGKLELNKDLVGFGINEDETRSPKDLAKFLKMQRSFFKDRDDHAALINKLNNFKATIGIDVEQNQDTRGNSKALVQKKVETNVPVNFVLELPVFIGFPKKSFMVEVCYDTTDAEVICWLESPGLQEIIIDERDRILDVEKAKFEAAGLVVIEK